mgnify:CR=1 FL=1
MSRMVMTGQPVAIFGKNGAGKTNILEAISLLSPGRGIRNAKTYDISKKPEGVGWKIKAILKNNEQILEVETFLASGPSRVVKIDEKIQSQISLSKSHKILWLSPLMDRLWIEGAEGRRKFLDRMTLNFIPDHGSIFIRFQKCLRQRNRLLKDKVNDEKWYDVLEEKLSIDGANLNKNRLTTIKRIHNALENLNPVFPKAKLSLIDIQHLDSSTNSEELKQTFKENRSKELSAGRTLVGPHRVDMSALYLEKNNFVTECSTGEQKAILISIILANAWSLSEFDGVPPILLLDEVTAHLDDNRRVELYDEILSLKAQVFMTGTDKKLFDSFGGALDLFEVIDNNGVSQIISA